MEPNFIRAYLRLALTYMRLGNPSEAGAMLESAKELAGGKEEPLAWFAHVYAASGQRAEALRALSQLNLQAEQDYVPAYVFAVIYAALGELDEAFVWLNKACEDRSGWMIFIAVDPVFEALQSDMRFTHLLRGLGDRSTLMIASESER
jgi:tetratricopeptide (TPR) repeat protein